MNKNIPIKYNSNNEKTVETIDEIAIWRSNEAQRVWTVNGADHWNNVSNTDATIDSNKFVEESVIAMTVDVPEEGHVDNKDGSNDEPSKTLIWQ